MLPINLFAELAYFARLLVSEAFQFVSLQRNPFICSMIIGLEKIQTLKIKLAFSTGLLHCENVMLKNDLSSKSQIIGENIMK